MTFYNYQEGDLIDDLENNTTYEVYVIDYVNEIYVLRNINDYDVLQMDKDSLESNSNFTWR